jgi:hypothetical protein
MWANSVGGSAVRPENQGRAWVFSSHSKIGPIPIAMRSLGSRLIAFVFGMSGLLFSGWIAYNLLLEETTEFTNVFSDNNLAGASALAGLIMAIVGFKLTGKGREEEADPRQTERRIASEHLESISAEALEQVRAAALEGRVIDAVKLYREATGAGLKEAKEVVDQLKWAA